MPNEVGDLLANWETTRPESASELLGLIYKDLRQLAASYMRNEGAQHTLQATALVNEAYLRLFDGKPFDWRDREHLFRAMALVMRRILVDHARARQAQRRGGHEQKVTLDERLVFGEHDPVEVIAIDEALDRLAKRNPRQSQVVELRFLAGLSMDETAALLNISSETVKLDWRFARAWLQNELTHNQKK